MKTVNKSNNGIAAMVGGVSALLTTSLFASSPAKAFADDPVSMAPPIQLTDATTPANADSVFNWSDIPVNQKVPLNQESFDKSGYQLYDTVGETILVPFTNDNLYVMKFAVSPDGTTYFINNGANPVLYLPRDGYLVNQSAGGAKWFPFTHDFAPSTPVYVGVAPSWDDFCGMGWYPGMVYYGGYWCGGPYFSIGALVPCDGFLISFGFNSFHGWGGYYDYYHGHPAPYFVGYYHGDFRHHDGFHNTQYAFRGGFGGGGGYNHGGFGAHEFRGAQGFHEGGGFGGTHSFSEGRTFHGGSGFNGGSTSSHSFQPDHEFRGAIGANGSRGGSFQSEHQVTAGQFHNSFSGGASENRSFNGGGSFHGGNTGGFHGGGGGSFHGGGSGGFHGGGGSSHGGGGGGSHSR